MVRDLRRLARAAVACLVATAAWTAGCGASKRSGAEPAEGSAGSGGAGTGGQGGQAGKGGAGRGAGGGITVAEAGAGGACEREVTLQAVVLGEPQSFDLIIVADHSDSLAWSRDELSSGLQSLLANVQGRSVRVFLLTPTQYGASSVAANTPFVTTTIVAWQDPATLEPYAGAVTEYVETCNDPGGLLIDCPEAVSQVPRVEHGRWNFVMPEPIAVVDPDMSDAEFASEQAAVADAILALGGSGSPQEQPLCTLGRYVSQPASDLPQNAVFLVISDEDDVSVPDDCLVSFDMSIRETVRQSGTEPCSADCDAYRYGMNGDGYLKIYPFTCAAFSDTGERIAGSERGGWLNVRSTEDCTGLSGACTPEEEAQAQMSCESGLRLVECTRECSPQPTRCEIDLTEPNIDACSDSFSYDGRVWANLSEYCATRGEGFRDCSGGGVNFVTSTSVSGHQQYESLMPGTDPSAVAQYFTSRAASAFGPERHLIEGIVFDPRFDCQLGAGQSYATNVIGAIGDPTHVFSLCDSYAPALEGVLDFAEALVQTEFTLALEDDERVTSVVVVGKDGSERALSSSDYTFDETSGRLSVEKSAIVGDDANLRVEVTSDCRPVVR
ncbi:MAG TPA: hypothetical protein VGK73_28360 [Polyangiaceae bacterium]